MSNERSREFTFDWTIDNFLSCYHKNGEKLVSPVFIAKTLDETHWYVQIFPRGGNEENKQYISYFLVRAKRESEAEEIEVTSKCELISYNGESLEQALHTRLMYKKGSGWGSEKFMEIGELKEKLDNLDKDTITFRCHMSVTVPELTSKCTAWTKIVVQRRSFNWRVKNSPSSSLWTENKTFLCSESLKIKVTLTALEGDAVNIAIQNFEEEHVSPRSVTCNLSLLDIKGIARNSRKSDYLFLPDEVNDTWQFPSFFTRTMLKTDECKYLKNDMFTLRCEFLVSNGTALKDIDGYYHDDPVNNQPCSAEAPVDTLQEDFRRMYFEQIQTDVKLRAEDKTFKVHKSILSARSPIFAKMFDQDANQTGTVDVEDVDANVLDSFLAFMYTGTVENMDFENASRLITVADRYQALILKEKCARFLMSALTTENVYNVLVTADKLVHEDLKASCIDFITTNSHIIFPSEAWTHFIQNNIKLASDVFHHLSVDFVFYKKVGK